jgi:hypothetical protein
MIFTIYLDKENLKATPTKLIIPSQPKANKLKNPFSMRAPLLL